MAGPDIDMDAGAVDRDALGRDPALLRFVHRTGDRGHTMMFRIKPAAGSAICNT